ERAPAALDAIMAQPIPPGQSAAAVDAFLSQPANLPSSAAEQAVLRVLLTKFVVPNVAIDETATRQKQQDARDNVPPQVVTFARGQVVVPEGSAITEADLEALRETGVVEDGLDLSKLLAGSLVALSFGVLVGGYLAAFGSVPAPAGRRLAIVGLTVAAVLAMVRFGVPPLLPDEHHQYLAFALPVASAGMIAAAFVGIEFGALIATLVGLTSAYLVVAEPAVPAATLRTSTDALQFAAAYTAGGLAGALGAYRVERLARFSIAAVLAILGVGGVLAIFWLLYDTSAPSWRGRRVGRRLGAAYPRCLCLRRSGPSGHDPSAAPRTCPGEPSAPSAAARRGTGHLPSLDDGCGPRGTGGGADRC
ncbi:MAG: hypothetical protein RMK15_03810, partial [Chloroflexota bacterium]|nr:hypothetical protein [Chloroflexota bacterium]